MRAFSRERLQTPGRQHCYLKRKATSGAPFRFLGAPVEAMHVPTDMIAMVFNAKFAPNDLSNARRGPQLRAVTVRLRPFKQQLEQSVPLAQAQLRPPSWREAHPQGIRAAATARSKSPHLGFERHCIEEDKPEHVFGRSHGMFLCEGFVIPRPQKAEEGDGTHICRNQIPGGGSQLPRSPHSWARWGFFGAR